MECHSSLSNPRLRSLLQPTGVPFEVRIHPRLHSVADSKRLRGMMPGAHIKNLVLRDAKHTVYLVTTLEDRQVDIKSLRKHVTASGNLSFVKPDVLLNLLAAEPGSVSPLSLVNDFGKQVKFFMDRDIVSHRIVNVLALRPDSTLSLSPHSLIDILEANGHQVTMLDFSADAS